MQINKWLLEACHSNLLYLRADFEPNACEMLSLRKVTGKIVKRRSLFLPCSRVCTFYFIQPVSDADHVLLFLSVFFFCESTFPLLHMNSFDGTFTSFIQLILVFLRMSQ